MDLSTQENGIRMLFNAKQSPRESFLYEGEGDINGVAHEEQQFQYFIKVSAILTSSQQFCFVR